MKDVEYIGGSEKALHGGKTFPKKVLEEAIVEITRLQHGLSPLKATKAMKGKCTGVIEWIKNGKPAYRLIYVVGKNAIYILHAFSKTSNDTPKADEDTIKARYKMLPKDI